MIQFPGSSLKKFFFGLALGVCLVGVSAHAGGQTGAELEMVGRDSFGVAMLYPTKAGGEAWTLPENPSVDARFDPQTSLTRNRDGSWKVRSPQVRMHVYTSTGFDASTISTYARDVLAERGYMQAPNDWKNVEMTGYVRVNKSAATPDENFSWQARGGAHTDTRPCEGSAYHAALHYDGTVRWQKESWHVSYDATPYTRGTKALRGQWVGFKAIIRDVTLEGGSAAVRLELWLDTAGDGVSWVKVQEVTDAGDWGGDASFCGGTVPAMPILWGGPIAIFRWDGARDVDFKWLSVREIEAPALTP